MQARRECLRFYDEQVRAFRDTVWSLRAAGKTLKEWHDFACRSCRPVTGPASASMRGVLR